MLGEKSQQQSYPAMVLKDTTVTSLACSVHCYNIGTSVLRITNCFMIKDLFHKTELISDTVSWAKNPWLGTISPRGESSLMDIVLSYPLHSYLYTNRLVHHLTFIREACFYNTCWSIQTLITSQSTENTWSPQASM